MNKSSLPRLARLLLKLMRLAPEEFRRRFEEEIIWVFSELWSAASPLQRVRLWFATALDLSRMLWREWLAALAQPRGAWNPNSVEVLLSLVPGRPPGELVEPRGLARVRADQQLNAYPELRGLEWSEKWEIWARAWPAVASDREILRLRTTSLLGIATSAGIGPLLVLPLLPQLGTAWSLALVPIAPLVTTCTLGLAWALMFRSPLVWRISRHLGTTAESRTN